MFFESKYLLVFIVYLGLMKFPRPQQELKNIFVELMGQAKMDRPSCNCVEDIVYRKTMIFQAYTNVIQV